MNQKKPNKLYILATSWDEKAKQAKISHPLKNLTVLPKMVGITPKTARFLPIKSLFYLIGYDKNKVFLKYFFKKPFTYALSLLKSYLQKESFTRDGDLFFYGVRDIASFKEQVAKENALVVVGFSYCHKPLECPSGRFTALCQNAQDHPVCSQCFIGKCSVLLEQTKAQVVYIPTIHYIGEKLFKITQNNPERPVYFLITACEMTLKMFGDWGNMIKAKGIGVRLDGRICNTMKAFHLSENGIKPGLTVVLDSTQEQMLDLIMSIPANTNVCV